MGDQHRLSRIDDTLTQLFESLLPFEVGNVDDTATLEWVEDQIQKAKTAVHDGHGGQPADVNQAQDLIKRKLLRENASPERASRFSNLYTRLLSMPVLNQKWAIIYLLYKLSEPRSEEAQAGVFALDEQHRSGQAVYGDRYDDVLDTEPQEVRHRRVVSDLGPLLVTSPRHERIQQRSGESLRRSSRDDRRRSPKDVPSSSKPSQSTKPAPNELELLRDLPFSLQGLSSTNLEFTSSQSIKLPATLPISILSLVHTLSEPCLLYKSLSDFTASQHGGLLGQSLRAALSNEMRSYLGLVATLEGEIRRALTAVEKGDSDKKDVRAAGVTLKRCVIWTRDATMGLRLMSLIVEESKMKKGGQIISLIHDLSSSHGDPFVGGFAERLLAHVAKPFYDMLRHWIYDGELADPYHEFFVVETDPSAKADIDPRRVATSIWEDKYKLDTGMVPSIVSGEFARKVFLIGKSLNFIRHNCGDSNWVIEYSQNNSKPLDYANTSVLSSSIDEAYQTTMSRLTYLMSTKFLLSTHLEAMKKYLLLSQGDFIGLLVESLAPNLDRPANSQYRHTLTSQLEHAIRHSNAQYDDPEVLRRLDARMIELGSGDTGWDCFTLEYKISPPCDVVITQWASTQYLKIFNLLLRIKRIEFSLNSTWRRCMTGARGVLATSTFSHAKSTQADLNSSNHLSNDWKLARCLIAEMVHFVNQLQYYILFEVIETSWERLQTAVNKSDATLDDLIDAHTKYINHITQKGLLASSADREDGFLVQLHRILKCMLKYRNVVESLYSFSVAEYMKRQQFSAQIEKRTAQGGWGITEKDFPRGHSRTNSRANTPSVSNRADKPLGIGGGTAGPSTQIHTHDDNESGVDSTGINTTGAAVGGSGGTAAGDDDDDRELLSSLRSTLSQLSTEFRSKISVFLYDLAHQPDVDMRFLGVVMNFNEAYKPVNPRRQAAHRREREREREKRKDSAPSTEAVTGAVTAATAAATEQGN